MVRPSTSPKFAILDPTTLEIAKSAEPFNADFRLIISSGAEVAKETTVIPIKIFGISNFKEIETAAFNSRFPPTISTTKPENNNTKVFNSMFLKACKDTTWIVYCENMKILFKIIAKINKLIIPSMTKKGLDPVKANKLQLAIIGWRYYITKNSL